jgi:hypothetical protein
VNWLIIVGIVVVAVGTLLLTYGGIFQNRKDTEQASKASETRLDQISRDLAELRGRPKSELPPDAIRRVEGEIKDWAATFASEKQKKKLALDERRLAHDNSLQHANTLAREYFAFAVSVLRDLVAKYPSESKLIAKVPDVPGDLFVNPETRFEGDIQFSETMSWKIQAYTTQPYPDVGTTMILVYLFENHPPSKEVKERGEFMLRFNNTAQTFHIRVRGDFTLATPVETLSKPTTEYEATIKSILKSLFEYQLLQE